VDPGGFEPPTDTKSTGKNTFSLYPFGWLLVLPKKWTRADSNHQPTDYELRNKNFLYSGSARYFWDSPLSNRLKILFIPSILFSVAIFIVRGGVK